MQANGESNRDVDEDNIELVNIEDEKKEKDNEDESYVEPIGEEDIPIIPGVVPPSPSSSIDNLRKKLLNIELEMAKRHDRKKVLIV